jgi:DNA-binding CsgD family transcriptional regulator
MDPNGALQSISPALEAALGDRMDGARLARLLEGTEAGFSTVATLQLADGTRLVGMTESAPARVERQLKHFADSHGLSPAERVALTDVAAGASAKASAERLGLSAETVRARRKRIFRRVGVDSCGAVLAMLLREQ